MEKHVENQLKRVKVQVKEIALTLDQNSAVELMNELADWAYREAENLLIDDEPVDSDEY